jgi:hypothetical protein
MAAGGDAMPIHDWTKVPAGTWHDFHLGWIAELRKVLNSGLLPEDYYAQAEQFAGPFGPDVLTLQESPDETPGDRPSAGTRSGGGIAVAVTPPKPRLVNEARVAAYKGKRRTVVVRHVSDDRVVALLELVSRGNKAGKSEFRKFVEKAAESLERGYHLMIVDLYPPTPRDPHGLHAAIWDELGEGEDGFELPPDAPLTLAAYRAGPDAKAYVEPTAVGRELIEMPLFLDPETYVNVPLEQTYMAAYAAVPKRWQRVLEAPTPPAAGD